MLLWCYNALIWTKTNALKSKSHTNRSITLIFSVKKNPCFCQTSLVDLKKEPLTPSSPQALSFLAAGELQASANWRCCIKESHDWSHDPHLAGCSSNYGRKNQTAHSWWSIPHRVWQPQYNLDRSHPPNKWSFMAAVPPVHRPRPFDDLVDELLSAMRGSSPEQTLRQKTEKWLKTVRNWRVSDELGWVL